MTTILSHSVGKHPDRNEDAIAFSGSAFVVADGATSLASDLFDKKSAGEVASQLVVSAALSTILNGEDLVRELNKSIYDFYEKRGALSQTSAEPIRRCTAAVACARVVGKELVVTCVGDVSFRFNGKLYLQEKQIDAIHAAQYSSHYAQHKDSAAARAHIEPNIRAQWNLLNDPEHELGYGQIDGHGTPSKFIHVFHLPLATNSVLEIFTDGYPLVAREPTIESWEEAYRQVQDTDPLRVKEFKSTKEKDDRSVLIVRFGD